MNFKAKKKGGIIVFSIEADFVEFPDNTFVNSIKQFVKTWKQSLLRKELIAPEKHNISNWSVGNFFEGKSTDKKGNIFSKKSLSIEIIGVTDDQLMSIVEDLCSALKQETALLKSYTSEKILYVNLN